MGKDKCETTRRGRRRVLGSKGMALVLAMILLAGGAVGGTLAWLTAESSEVRNVFTTSDIGVTLEESADLNLKMIPGWTIAKDPKATVTSGSEDCYLFVKVEKSANFDDYMTYTIADGWTELESAAGANSKVYYKVFDSKSSEVNKPVMGTAYPILKDNQVSVKDTVTKEMMTAADFAQPALNFTAYASQLYKSNTVQFTAQEAWNNVPKNE